MIILIAEFLGIHALRADGENLFTVQLEVIRTLPHIAERLFRGNDFHQFPVEQIVALIEQNRSAVIVHPRALHHIIDAVFLPDFGITDMARAVFRIILRAEEYLLLTVSLSVFRADQDGIALTAIVDVIIVTGQLDVAGLV